MRDHQLITLHDHPEGIIATLTPQVSPELQERLAQIDPALHIRVQVRAQMDRIANDPLGDPTRVPQYVTVVCLRWPENDRRRELAKMGQLDPTMDFDWLGDLPNDCNLDQVPGYLMRMLKRMGDGWARRAADKVQEWNDTLALKRGEEMADFGAELLGGIIFNRNADERIRIPRSFGGLGENVIDRKVDEETP